MTKYYEIIDGIKCDSNLYNYAKELTKGKGDGRISEQDAILVYKEAMDGNIVTAIEKDTIKCIIKNLNPTDKAREYLEEKINDNYYKIIEGIKCDRKLYNYALELVKGKGDGRISEQDALNLIHDALDGGKITDIEKNTIKIIINKLNCTEKAINIFNENID